MSKPDLRDNLFRERRCREVFEDAHRYGMSYLEGMESRRVYPGNDSLERLQIFDEHLPDGGCGAKEVLKLLHDYGAPATVNQSGGRYFGFVNGGVLPVSQAARVLADYWDQNSALTVMSPAVGKLEEVTERWLSDLLGLPSETVCGFVSGTSVSILCGLAAARHRIYGNLGWDINRSGMRGAPNVRFVTGKQAHATVLKAVSLLGFGTDNIETVDCDSQGRVLPDRVPQLDSSTIVVLQAGNVSTGAFDPFAEVCDMVRRAGAWVHIDGAFGLWAAASENLAHLVSGIELADSWSVDAHKTLNAPYDNGIVLCRHRDSLANALQASGSYISWDTQRDGMLYTPEMSRRARVVELWAALKYLGKSGVDELVTGLHQRAVQATSELSDAGFRVLNDVVFNQVLLSCESDEATRATLRKVQESGECWAGGVKWDGRDCIRFSVCSWATTEEDISRSVATFVSARNSL